MLQLEKLYGYMEAHTAGQRKEAWGDSLAVEALALCIRKHLICGLLFQGTIVHDHPSREHTSRHDVEAAAEILHVGQQGGSRET